MAAVPEALTDKRRTITQHWVCGCGAHIDSLMLSNGRRVVDRTGMGHI